LSTLQVCLHVATVVYVHPIFFFKAEDGIRDCSVTGVQTCALPISLRPAVPGRSLVTAVFSTGNASAYRRTSGRLGLGKRRGTPRSEERRVGKECRSWRSPCHYKKERGTWWGARGR